MGSDASPKKIGNVFHTLFPRLAGINSDYTQAISNQITSNPYDLFDLTQDLAVAAVPFSEELGQSCLGIDYKKLYGADGTISSGEIKKFQALCHDLKKCADHRVQYYKANFRNYLQEQSPSKETSVQDFEGEYPADIDIKKKSLKEQYEYIAGELKKYMSRSTWQAVKDLFKGARKAHEDALGKLWYTAEHLFETDKMEELLERAAEHYGDSGLQAHAAPETYIEAVLQDSVNINRLKEGAENINYLLEHFYTPAAQIYHATNNAVNYINRLYDINRCSAYALSKAEVDAVKRTYRTQLEQFQQWKTAYPILGKASIFEHLVDRYIRSVLYAAYLKKSKPEFYNDIPAYFIDCGQAFYASQINKLKNIAFSYYPKSDRSGNLGAKQKKRNKRDRACAKALVECSTEISGEIMRQVKSDLATINTANHDFHTKAEKSKPNRSHISALDKSNSYKVYIEPWLQFVYDELPPQQKERFAEQLQIKLNDDTEGKLPNSFRPFLKSVHTNDIKLEAFMKDRAAEAVQGLGYLFKGLRKLFSVPPLLVHKVFIELPAYASVWADGRLDDKGMILNMPATFREAGLYNRAEVAQRFRDTMTNCEDFVKLSYCFCYFYCVLDSIRNNILSIQGGTAPASKVRPWVFCGFYMSDFVMTPMFRRECVDRALNTYIDYIGNSLEIDDPAKLETLGRHTKNLALAEALDLARNVCNDREKECGRIEYNVALLNIMTAGEPRSEKLFHQLLDEGKLLSEVQLERVCQCLSDTLEQDQETGMIQFRKDVNSQNLSVDEFVRGAIAACLNDGRTFTSDVLMDTTLNNLIKKVRAVTQNGQAVLPPLTLPAPAPAQTPPTQMEQKSFKERCEAELDKLQDEIQQAIHSKGKPKTRGRTILACHARRIAVARRMKEHELYHLANHPDQSLKNPEQERRLQRDMEKLDREEQKLTIANFFWAKIDPFYNKNSVMLNTLSNNSQTWENVISQNLPSTSNSQNVISPTLNTSQTNGM